MKKKIIIIIALLGLIIICWNLLKKPLKLNTYTVSEVNQYPYSCEGMIIPEKIDRVYYQGYLEYCYVKVGQQISEQQKLVKVNDGTNSKIIKSNKAGVVYQINDSYLEIASITKIIEIPVSINIGSAVDENTMIEIDDNKGKIVYLNKVLNQQQQIIIQGKLINDNYYYNQTLKVTILLTKKKVYTIPLNGVINCKGKNYVFLTKWLDNPLELHDYLSVNVLTVVDGICYVDDEQINNQEIVLFDDDYYQYARGLLNDNN